MAEDEEYFEDAELDFDELEGDDYGLGDQGGWADDDPETITLEYDDLAVVVGCDIGTGFHREHGEGLTDLIGRAPDASNGKERLPDLPK